MTDRLNPTSTNKAKEMALFIGDYLYDSGETPEIQMNASAIAHASICFSYGLDVHKSLEAVLHMYKQMEERLGKA